MKLIEGQLYRAHYEGERDSIIRLIKYKGKTSEIMIVDSQYKHDIKRYEDWYSDVIRDAYHLYIDIEGELSKL